MTRSRRAPFAGLLSCLPPIPRASRGGGALLVGVAALVLLVGCLHSPPPGPPNPPEPPEPEPCAVGECPRDLEDPLRCVEGECVPCPEIPGAIWHTAAGDVVCSTPERPVKHWPPSEECPVLTEPCDVPPPPPPPPPPPSAECFRFPQGVPDADFTGGPTTSVLGTQVNAAIERVTRCPIGTDCVAGEAEQFYAAVNTELRSTGLWAGRHDDEPPGASDEIAVATSCTGRWESYHIYNFGGGKVVWSPSAARAAYKIDPKWCPSECTPEPEPEPEPEPTECPLPHPDMSQMKLRCGEHNGILDCTLTTVMQCQFCEDIGMGDFGGQPRCGCPVRPECGAGVPPDAICHDRIPCEKELCDEKWSCNGVEVPGWNGNYAQSNCRGHWKTWCANAPNVVAEGDR